MTQERDREFEQYLEGDSDLSDAYGRMPQDGPPAHLDHAILAEAHRAVRAPRADSGWRRWSVPLSVAATLIVAVLVGLERPYLPQEGGMPQRAPAVAPAPEPATMEEKADRRMDTFQAAPSTRQEPVRGRASQEAAPAMKKEAAPAPRLKALRDENELLESPAAAKPAPSFRQMPAAPAMLAPGQHAPQQDKLKALPPPAAMEEVAPASEMAPAPVVSAPPVANAIQPQAWLMRIRQLKGEGKRAEASRELAAFSKRYPRYTIPEDLRDLRQ